jgi:predicted Zn-dependent protease
MKNRYAFSPGILFLLICLLVSPAYGQKTKKVLYDDWPVTVKSNAEWLKKRGDGIADYVTVSSWDRRILTYFFQNGTEDITGDGERQAVRDGFAIWSAQTDLVFLEVCTAAAADIVILWGVGNHGDASPFDGTGNVLAHAYYPPPTGGALAGDIHFDDSEQWVNQTRSGSTQPMDLVTVAAHEIGHALGLNHTTVAGSLMEATYNGSRRYLGTDDYAGIQSLYGPATGSTMVTGTTPFCNSSTFTLQGVPAGTTVSWSTSPTSMLSSTSFSGTGVTANLTRGGTFGGRFTLTYTLQTACGTTTVRRINLWAGNPGLQQMTYGTEGSGQTSTVSTVNFVQANVWYVVRTNTESAQLTSGVFWSPNININGYTNGSHEYRFRMNAGQSVNIGVSASNTCGSSSRTITFTTPSSFSVSPNPASDVVQVEFSSTSNLAALPEQLTLVSEKSAKPVRSIKVSEVFASKGFKDGNKVELLTKDLPRGTYYLHILSPRLKDKPLEVVRILLQ